MSIAEAVGKTGVTYPNVKPYDDISLLVVAWNEEARIERLLEYLKPYFSGMVVCVQESTDRTLELVKLVADRPEDTVLTDRHWGHGDKSFPRMVRNAATEWCFVVSCDEWPSEELLDSLMLAIAVAELDKKTSEAIWVPFRSWIDDLETEAGYGHLRLFKTIVGWPDTLHSRPMTQRGIWWPHGWIEHRRSLDEMMRDYLAYFERGRGNIGWENHNRAQMQGACNFVAATKGWDYVMQYDWWPEVKRIAF